MPLDVCVSQLGVRTRFSILGYGYEILVDKYDIFVLDYATAFSCSLLRFIIVGDHTGFLFEKKNSSFATGRYCMVTSDVAAPNRGPYLLLL